jgi:hypothetical protein
MFHTRLGIALILLLRLSPQSLSAHRSSFICTSLSTFSFIYLHTPCNTLYFSYICLRFSLDITKHDGYYGFQMDDFKRGS